MSIHQISPFLKGLKDSDPQQPSVCFVYGLHFMDEKFIQVIKDDDLTIGLGYLKGWTWHINGLDQPNIRPSFMHAQGMSEGPTMAPAMFNIRNPVSTDGTFGLICKCTPRIKALLERTEHGNCQVALALEMTALLPTSRGQTTANIKARVYWDPYNTGDNLDEQASVVHPETKKQWQESIMHLRSRGVRTDWLNAILSRLNRGVVNTEPLFLPQTSIPDDPLWRQEVERIKQQIQKDQHNKIVGRKLQRVYQTPPPSSPDIPTLIEQSSSSQPASRQPASDGTRLTPLTPPTKSQIETVRALHPLLTEAQTLLPGEAEIPTSASMVETAKLQLSKIPKAVANPLKKLSHPTSKVQQSSTLVRKKQSKIVKTQGDRGSKTQKTKMPKSQSNPSTSGTKPQRTNTTKPQSDSLTQGSKDQQMKVTKPLIHSSIPEGKSQLPKTVEPPCNTFIHGSNSQYPNTPKSQSDSSGQGKIQPKNLLNIQRHSGNRARPTSNPAPSAERITSIKARQQNNQNAARKPMKPTPRVQGQIIRNKEGDRADQPMMVSSSPGLPTGYNNAIVAQQLQQRAKGTPPVSQASPSQFHSTDEALQRLASIPLDGYQSMAQGQPKRYDSPKPQIQIADILKTQDRLQHANPDLGSRPQTSIRINHSGIQNFIEQPEPVSPKPYSQINSNILHNQVEKASPNARHKSQTAQGYHNRLTQHQLEQFRRAVIPSPALESFNSSITQPQLDQRSEHGFPDRFSQMATGSLNFRNQLAQSDLNGPPNPYDQIVNNSIAQYQLGRPHRNDLANAHGGMANDDMTNRLLSERRSRHVSLNPNDQLSNNSSRGQPQAQPTTGADPLNSGRQGARNSPATQQTQPQGRTGTPSGYIQIASNNPVFHQHERLIKGNSLGISSQDSDDGSLNQQQSEYHSRAGSLNPQTPVVNNPSDVGQAIQAQMSSAVPSASGSTLSLTREQAHELIRKEILRPEHRENLIRYHADTKSQHARTLETQGQEQAEALLNNRKLKLSQLMYTCAVNRKKKVAAELRAMHQFEAEVAAQHMGRQQIGSRQSGSEHTENYPVGFQQTRPPQLENQQIGVGMESHVGTRTTINQQMLNRKRMLTEQSRQQHSQRMRDLQNRGQQVTSQQTLQPAFDRDFAESRANLNATRQSPTQPSQLNMIQQEATRPMTPQQLTPQEWRQIQAQRSRFEHLSPQQSSAQPISPEQNAITQNGPQQATPMKLQRLESGYLGVQQNQPQQNGIQPMVSEQWQPIEPQCLEPEHMYHQQRMSLSPEEQYRSALQAVSPTASRQAAYARADSQLALPQSEVQRLTQQKRKVDSEEDRSSDELKRPRIEPQIEAQQIAVSPQNKRKADSDEHRSLDELKRTRVEK